MWISFFQLVPMVLERQIFSMVNSFFRCFYCCFFSFIFLREALHLASSFFILKWNCLLSAIRFVLSDLFQNLRSEDRHALLHVRHLTYFCFFLTCQLSSYKMAHVDVLFWLEIWQEGAGHQVVSAFVEIVFDNSDNRIPVCLPFSL